jgi:hypothetical protein
MRRRRASFLFVALALTAAGCSTNADSSDSTSTAAKGGTYSAYGTHTVGVPVVVPLTQSGIDKVSVSDFYVNVTPPSDAVPPVPGAEYDAADVSECAGPKRSSEPTTSTDFSLILPDRDPALPARISGPFSEPPLASLRMLGSSGTDLGPNQCDRGWVAWEAPTASIGASFVTFGVIPADLSTPTGTVKWAVNALGSV